MSDERLKLWLSFGLAFLMVGGIIGLHAMVSLGRVEATTSIGQADLSKTLQIIAAGWISVLGQGLWKAWRDGSKSDTSKGTDDASSGG